MKNINPHGPSQKYPNSASPITKDPKGVDQGHQNSDLNSSIFAQHHNLGPTPNQASPGDHVHDGSNSKQFNDLSILGLLTAGNIAWGSIDITPSGANAPTAGPITFNIKGSTFVGFATPMSGVPGTTVTGVGIINITNTTASVILTRTNTTTTTVYWLVIGI